VSGPHPVLLDRDKAVADVATQFSDALGLFKEVVDHGTTLIAEIFDEESASIVRDVVVGGLLGGFVRTLDGIHVLLEAGACGAARPLGRSLLEFSFTFEWMLKEDSETRALAFDVWNLRQEIVSLRRVMKGTPEHTALVDSIKTTLGARMPSVDLPDSATTASAGRIEAIEAWLDMEPQKAVNDRFAKIAAKRGSEPTHWYVGAGAANMWELVKQIGQQGRYNTFWKEWSRATHANDYGNSVVMREGLVILPPLRRMDGADLMVAMPLSLATATYRLAYRRFLPSKLWTFESKRDGEWRPRFDAIPRIDETVLPIVGTPKRKS
jgi:hypothetical protein